jgi:hypothetical protein
MRFSKLSSLGAVLSLCMAATVVSGSGMADAAELRGASVADGVQSSSSAVGSAGGAYSLSPALIIRAGRYIRLDAAGRGSLNPAAQGVLSSSDLRLVTSSLVRYNSVETKQGTRSGSLTLAGSRLLANASSKVHGPTCGWHISWNYYWYGWTVKLNGCLVDWLTYATAATAGIAALVATIQAYLDIPADVVAIVAGLAAAGSGLMALQLKTCQQLGYHGGVSYNSKFGIKYPGCY